eukprot:Rmarinus@m.25588
MLYRGLEDRVRCCDLGAENSASRLTISDYITMDNVLCQTESDMEFFDLLRGEIPAICFLGELLHCAYPGSYPYWRGIRMGICDERRYRSWMGQLGNAIADVPLGRLIIPGTHDSATDRLDLKIAPNAPKGLRGIFSTPGISTLLSPILPIIRSWALAQGVSVGAQLSRGVRYLDLRVSQMAPGDFRICHSLCGHHVNSVLDEIEVFLRAEETELLILEFKHFYDFDATSHTKLVETLKYRFGDIVVSPRRDANVTVGELWAAKERIVILYGNEDVASRHPDFIWHTSRIHSSWANAQRLPLLKTFLNAVVRRRRRFDHFHVLQGLLTPDGAMIACGLIPFSGKPSSLRDLALITNPAVLRWVCRDWKEDNINVIICDFVEDTCFVDAAIEINEYRYALRKGKTGPVSSPFHEATCPTKVDIFSWPGSARAVGDEGQISVNGWSPVLSGCLPKSLRQKDQRYSLVSSKEATNNADGAVLSSAI